MNKQQYNVLLTAVIILENRFQSYLNDTPITVVQGDRSALKEAMRSLINTFNNIDTPDGVNYDETVKLALESLTSVPEASKTLGDDAITDGKQEFNQDGSRVDGAEDKDEPAIKPTDGSFDEVNAIKDVKDEEEEQKPQKVITNDMKMFLDYPMIQVIEIAELCHNTNRDYCIEQGDDSQILFANAPENIQQSAIDGVKRILENPEMTAEESHNNWLTYKINDGWVYGEVKDLEAKTHPDLVPFDELSETEQYKDELFIKTVLEAIAE